MHPPKEMSEFFIPSRRLQIISSTDPQPVAAQDSRVGASKMLNRKMTATSDRASSRAEPRWLTSDDLARWDMFVAAHPLGLIYHTSSWKKVLEESFPHIQGKFLALSNPENGDIKSCLALYCLKSWLLGTRLVSIPLATFGNALVESPGDFSKLVSLMGHSHPPERVVEFRVVQAPHLLDGSNFSVTSHIKHHYIKLNRSLPDLLSNCSQLIRRMISKATKEGLVVVSGTNEDDLKTFYDLFVRTRRRLKLPPIPFRFFSALWKQFFPKNLSILLAYRGTHAVSGMLVLKYKNYCHMDYVGEFARENSGANQLLYWEAIKLASNEGYDFFSLGRTSPDNKGLIEHKRHWGTVEEDLPILTFDSNGTAVQVPAQSGLSYRLARRLSGCLPMPLYHLMGKFCYSHWG